jgi:mannosyltransferase OCH1-like enzyme
MIQKIIHYCWFGGKEKPDLVKKCIESWKCYCPDYEMKEWNEESFDVYSAPVYARLLR